MSQVKVTFKKVPQLGKLVRGLDGELKGLEACTKCELHNTKTGVNCHTIYNRSCIDYHWQKAKS